MVCSDNAQRPRSRPTFPSNPVASARIAAERRVLNSRPATAGARAHAAAEAAETADAAEVQWNDALSAADDDSDGYSAYGVCSAFDWSALKLAALADQLHFSVCDRMLSSILTGQLQEEAEVARLAHGHSLLSKALSGSREPNQLLQATSGRTRASRSLRSGAQRY
eukprot:5327755-Prymnesium_polylepis.1